MENSVDLDLILKRARNMSLSFERPYVCIDLLLDSMLFSPNSSIRAVFKAVGLGMPELRMMSQIELLRLKKSNKPTDKYNKDVKDVISLANELTREYEESECRPEILLLAISLSEKRPKLFKFLEEEGFDIANFSVKLSSFIVDDFSDSVYFIDKFEQESFEEDIIEEKGSMDMFESNPIIDQFADNLNIRAEKGDFDNLIDFNDVLKDLEVILCRQKKPNAILVGKGGTGKSAILEMLAKKIVNGDAPDHLSNKVIYSVDLSRMVSGTEFRGMFEERINEFIDEVKRYDNVILFFDEIHTLVGAGGAGRANDLEASNILKPPLARGEISCIGATTMDEYNLKIKPDAALSRRFNKIIVNEPSRDQMEMILENLAEFYENFHNVIFSKPFLENVIDFCEKYMPNKVYPDKLIDVLDHCGAVSKMRYDETPEEIKKAQKELRNIAERGAQEKWDSDKFKEISGKLEEIKSVYEEWEVDNIAKPRYVEFSDLEKFFEKEKSLFSREVNFDKLIKEVPDEKGDLILNLGKYLNTKNDSSIILFYGSEKSGKSLICRKLSDFARRKSVSVIKFSGMDFNAADLCKRVSESNSALIVVDDVKFLNKQNLDFLCKILKDKIFERSDGEVISFHNVDFIVTASAEKRVDIGFGKLNKNPKPEISEDLLKSFDKTFYLEEYIQKEKQNA